MEPDEDDTVNVDAFKLPISVENELKLPLPVLFTGHFNGFGVEIKLLNEMSLLYQWSCFGKGSVSRSKPNILNRDNGNYEILRKRQFMKREEWVKKFNEKRQPSARETGLQSDITKLIGLIRGSPEGCKNVIDLVSSDEEMAEANEHNEEGSDSTSHIAVENVAIVVPNSDSEDDDYFQNFKPKCCFNKVKMDECLMLTLQEAYFLAYAFGCLQILDLDKNPLSLERSWRLFVDTDRDFVTKYIVYHYFRSKGYVVKPGIKFGGDYLLYKEGPGHGHADYIVLIKYNYSCNHWLPTLGHIRMAGTTSKDILVAELKPSPDPIEHPMPQNLCNYSVRETIIRRRIPCNKDDEDE